MFVVTEAEAAAIRATFEQRGELAAAVELRRLFPGIHRHDAGAGMRSDHRLRRRPGDTTACWQEPLKRLYGPVAPARTSSSRPPC